MPTNWQILPGLLVSISLPLNGAPSLERTATVANRVPRLELSVILTFEGVTVTTNSVAGFCLAASADPKQPEIIAIENTVITKRPDVRELSNGVIPTTCSTDVASILLYSIGGIACGGTPSQRRSESRS
jgi:hypothetical protein